MDKIDIKVFLDKLSRHESAWLTLLRESGGFQFQPMPVAPGVTGSTSDPRSRADWLAHPQEMPAMTALHGLYYLKCFKDINADLESSAEQSAYRSKKEITMGIAPAMKSEIDLCVNEYLSSVAKYFENGKGGSSGAETCRDANAAILLTLAIASNNQESTKAIIKAIPGALDVYLCKDMIQPSRLDNEWIRPAAAIVLLSAPDMVDCLMGAGWKPTDKTSVLLKTAPAENDFLRASELGPQQGGTLFHMLTQQVSLEIPTHPKMVDVISAVSKEVWSPKGSHTDVPVRNRIEFFANETLNANKKGTHSEVVLLHLLSNGVVDYIVNDLALAACKKSNIKFMNSAAHRLDWQNLRFEENRFIPSLLAQALFENQEFTPGLIHQTVVNLCKACIASGHGEMLKGDSVMEKYSTPHRPLNDFIKANCVDAVIMALDEGANPQEVSVLGHNAFWYARNSGHEGMEEILSAHVKKKAAMAILDELFEPQRGMQP